MANQITAAEVLEVIYEDTNPNLIYGLKVKEFGGTPTGDVNSLAAITAPRPITPAAPRKPFALAVFYFPQNYQFLSS